VRGEPAAPTNRGAITISIMLAPIMQGVDTTIANVALPHMQGSLSASQDQIAWVLTSYIVAAAIMTPLTGWLAGRFGIKYVFLISVAGFTLASALCGIATSLAQLVIYRVLQGVCGAALVPLSQSVLLQINPPERHARAMAVWGAGTILGPGGRCDRRATRHWAEITYSIDSATATADPNDRLEAQTAEFARAAHHRG
jgi:MFS transporter, DHA2 family, multidrug resistance protein